MIIVIETDEKVPAGIVTKVLEEKGGPWKLVRPASGEPLPPPGEVSAAIILGGRMGANDEAKFPFIGALKEFIRESAAEETPVLGICLGGQIMAEALGGRVHSNRNGEKGISDVRLTTLGCFDPIFGQLPYDFVTFHWHNDSFVLPDGAVLLATNGACPAQAFRYGRSIYALQFHPEMDRETARRWSEEEKRPEIFEKFETFASDHELSGRAVISNFVRMAERQ